MKSSNPLPKAASAFIYHQSGLILAVSRKHDSTDLNLPGGKLDPNESYWEAVVRETAEETNLIVTEGFPLLCDPCGTPGIHHVHQCMTFVCKAEGELRQMEAGRVVWVPPQRIVERPDGTLNSFSEYNQRVLDAYKTIEFGVRRYYFANLEIPKEFALEYTYLDD
jgi:8-oxo-dGTP pyrophosphatase MutT (NUDIX family)